MKFVIKVLSGVTGEDNNKSVYNSRRRPDRSSIRHGSLLFLSPEEQVFHNS